MKNKIKKYAEIFILAIIFYFSNNLYRVFLLINWAVEEWQKKRWYKDRGEKKYDKEVLVIFAIMIPEGTRLTGPEVKRVFAEELSENHIYQIIEFRKIMNEKNPMYIKFMREKFLRGIFPKDYA